jgi:hypothetical protein
MFFSSAHVRDRKRWDFLSTFVLHGGLPVLAALLNDSNLYVRGQAFEIFLSITDCDTYDWFKDDSSIMSTKLRCHMFVLKDDPNFINSLLFNRTNSYPGGKSLVLVLCRCLIVVQKVPSMLCSYWPSGSAG